MALTDTFVKTVKFTGKAAAGDKHSDAGGLHLLVKEAGKYWRLNYRYLGKQKTLALGVYPSVSLAQARQRREDAKKLLAQGTDPGEAKKTERLLAVTEAANTFEAVARSWLEKTKADRTASTQSKVEAWLVKNVFPGIGSMPIAAIGPRDVLAVIRKIEARKAI